MLSKSIRKSIVAFSCVLALGTSTSVMATAHTEVSASAIQIQSYGNVGPVLFYTGSVCSNQHLNLDPIADVDTQKLLWAAVLSAKATGSKVGFDYDFNADNCIIRSFSVNPN
ncbi:hypothetical protein [Luteibacter sp. RCC_6_2]|uniref:hypothetical protein n=1 Tax=Luteibacter sp. RCC_6_2 TaxID=3239223 RepID=UPI0035262637